MEKKHKGALSELKACSWLLEQGYEVFRNVSPHGKIDLIAVKEDESIFIDVKTSTTFKLKDGSLRANHTNNADSNIKILCVDYDLNKCFWAKQDYAL